VVSATFWPLYLSGTRIEKYLIGRNVGSRAGLDTVEENRYIALRLLTQLLGRGE
jgi:hypothetical protein